MHGFDTKVKAPTTQRMLKLRTEFMKKLFWNEYRMLRFRTEFMNKMFWKE